MNYVDLCGFPIKKSPVTNPYDYDAFKIWKKNSYSTIGYLFQNQETNMDHVVMSDRLYQRNPDLFNECCQKIWGNQYTDFDGRSPLEIERFLSLYLDTKCELTAITKECNKGNGYPLWTFYYK